jgi:hypothetical protein
MPQLKRIVSLWFDSTGITCFPNYGNVTNSYPALNTVPICTAGNTNACAVYTSIHEPAQDNVTLKFYPNPASDNLHIESPLQNAIFRITDMVGKTWVVYPSGKEIDISGLAPGMYCLQIQTSDGTSIGRFLKE